MGNFVSAGAICADIALICTFVISIFLAFRKGFTVLVFNFICLIITIIAVIALCKPITTLVYEHTKIDEFFSKHIKNSIGDFLEEQLEKNNHIDPDKTNIAKPIAEKINNYIDESGETTVKSISSYVAEKLAYIVISALVIIVLFITFRLATILLRAVLYFITELPIIHSIDKAGGVAYGVLRAFTIVYLILAIFSLLSPLISNTGIIAAINSSKVCSIFYNNNLFLKLLIK